MEELTRLQSDIEFKKSLLKTEKKRTAERFRRENKKIYTFLHIIMVFIVLFNFGALTLTHMMVNKVKIEDAKAAGKEIVYFETVQSTAKNHNLVTLDDLDISEEEKEAKSLMVAALFFTLFKQSFIWAVLYSLFYIYYIHTYNYRQLYITIFFVALYFSITGYDLFYDLGLFLAEVKYG